MIKNGEMKMKWIPTTEIADILTKPLARPRFEKLRQMHNMTSRDLFERSMKQTMGKQVSFACVVSANHGTGTVGYAKLA